MSWLLLAVFVALAGLSATAWHEQVQRQNDQAFAAQAASVGASVTTAVRRMDDLTLAARTLLATNPDLTNKGFERWYDAMGVDERFSGIAGFAYVSIERGRVKEKIYPPGKRPYYCLPRVGVSGPGMDQSLQEAAVPGFDLCQLTKLLADTRDSGEFSAFVVSSSHGHDMFEVVAPVYRGGGVPRTRRSGGRAPRAGSSASSTPSRSCAPRSPASSASTSRWPASTPRSPRTACRPAPAPPFARWPRRSAARRSRATARRRRRPR